MEKQQMIDTLESRISKLDAVAARLMEFDDEQYEPIISNIFATRNKYEDLLQQLLLTEPLFQAAK